MIYSSTYPLSQLSHAHPPSFPPLGAHPWFVFRFVRLPSLEWFLHERKVGATQTPCDHLLMMYTYTIIHSDPI